LKLPAPAEWFEILDFQLSGAAAKRTAHILPKGNQRMTSFVIWAKVHIILEEELKKAIFSWLL
jgi:hypothetical protein